MLNVLRASIQSTKYECIKLRLVRIQGRREYTLMLFISLY